MIAWLYLAQAKRFAGRCLYAALRSLFIALGWGDLEQLVCESARQRIGTRSWYQRWGWWWPQ